MQKVLVMGRPLEIEDATRLIEGQVNCIMVNRYDSLKTAFEEIKTLGNKFLTLQVQCYDEVIILYTYKLLP